MDCGQDHRWRNRGGLGQDVVTPQVSLVLTSLVMPSTVRFGWSRFRGVIHILLFLPLDTLRAVTLFIRCCQYGREFSDIRRNTVNGTVMLFVCERPKSERLFSASFQYGTGTRITEAEVSVHIELTEDRFALMEKKKIDL